MPIPKDLPKEMRGLWMHQYESREKKLLSHYESFFNKESKKKYKKMKYFQKIAVIDRLQARGVFE